MTTARCFTRKIIGIEVDTGRDRGIRVNFAPVSSGTDAMTTALVKAIEAKRRSSSLDEHRTGSSPATT